MSKKDWFFVIAPLFLVWLVDRLTKIWALELVGVQFYGPVGFVLHHNHGAMLGLFSSLPPVLRVVSLSTGGGFLLFAYGVVQYLLPVRSILLRAGMSILLGGILGNVTDRIIWGHVVDFILLGSLNSSSPAFNLADALQWVGYGMIVVSLVRENEILWPAKNLRSMQWVNPEFQLKYCLTLVAVGLAFAVISGVFAYTYLRVTIIELVGPQQRLLDQFLIPFVLTFSIVSFTFATILFLFGRILSHRIAGPLYAFERYLTGTLAGEKRVLRFRAGDEFKQLESLAAQLSERINSNPESVERPASAQPKMRLASSEDD